MRLQARSRKAKPSWRQQQLGAKKQGQGSWCRAHAAGRLRQRQQRQPSAAALPQTNYPTAASHAHQGASQHHAATDVPAEARRRKDAAARRAVRGEEQQRHAGEDGHRAGEEKAQAGHSDEQGCRGGRGRG